MTPDNTEDALIRLIGPKEHPAAELAVYCTPGIYAACIKVTQSPSLADVLKRRDSLLTSMSAAVNRALRETKGEIVSIEFKHAVKYGNGRGQRKLRDVVVYPRHILGTGAPYLMLCEPGWLPDDGEVVH